MATGLDHKTSVFINSCLKPASPACQNLVSEIVVGYGIPNGSNKTRKYSKKTSTKSHVSSVFGTGKDCNSFVSNNRIRGRNTTSNKQEGYRDYNVMYAEQEHRPASTESENANTKSDYYCEHSSDGASCLGLKSFEKLKNMDPSSVNVADVSRLCESIDKVKREHKKALKKLENQYNRKHQPDNSNVEHEFDMKFNDVHDNINTNNVIPSHKYESFLSNDVSRLSKSNLKKHQDNIESLLKIPVHPKTSGRSRATGYMSMDWRNLTSDERSDTLQNKPTDSTLHTNTWNNNDTRPYESKYAWEESELTKVWDDYSVGIDASKELPLRSSSMCRSPSPTKIGNNGWHHGITVPQPFKMTIRAEQKPKTKSKAQLQIEKQKLEKQMAEEAECRKVFRAKPPPAHVYLPLYNVIMAEEEVRRKDMRENNKRTLLLDQRPFSFVWREEEKKRRVQSQLAVNARSRKESRSVSPSFKATNPPKAVYSREVHRKLEEQEFYRKIKIHMRSLEMLTSSKLPPRMEAHQRRMRERTETKSRKSGAFDGVTPSFTPGVHDVPDFQAIHNQLQRQNSLLGSPQYTQCNPFNLRTANIKSNVDVIANDIVNDEKKLKESRWPYTGSREKRPPSSLKYRSASVGCIPTRITSAASRQQALARLQKEEEKKNEESMKGRQSRQRKKHEHLRRHLYEKLEAESSGDLETLFTEKVKKNKESEATQLAEYKKSLQEMLERVESRPLLMDQQAQLNAKKAIEKRFEDALRSAGISEDYIKAKSQEEPQHISVVSADETGEIVESTRCEEEALTKEDYNIEEDGFTSGSESVAEAQAEVKSLTRSTSASSTSSTSSAT
ncbi:PREDICTED: protein FAM161B-like [Priapulus caudatus]|uniref:Protein FAM161B-like n=1 Tax=Priapulus caudatus TaxID=37621 RepID=A0ABM1ED39_PRICU|nr:PREDICTED: protein FAM161B-like [Priapulus caudatus]